jgi:hypothetical protein
MDKYTPVIQATPVTPETPATVSTWYSTETTSGAFTPSQIGWLHAQGFLVTSYSKVGANPALWALARRVVKPEKVLQSLVTSYTNAYNTGRTLNDNRYDDLVVLYTALLDRTEDSYNLLETDDTAYEGLITTLIAAIDTDHTAYDTDVTGDLDDWGTDQKAEINARFDAESAAAAAELRTRGMYTGAQWPTTSAGVERERTRALNQINDIIEQRQLELKHTIQKHLDDTRTRVEGARTRLRQFLHGSKDRQVDIRNATAAALRAARRRTRREPCGRREPAEGV